MDLSEKIKNITRYEYMKFFEYPNVVGVGRGNKYINDVDTGRLCIKVYVREKYKKECNGEGCVPKYYFGIPTDVIETGDFTTSSYRVGKGFQEKIRPVKMGYGIAALPLPEEIGTAGCIVTRSNPSGNLEIFILSCNHVLADHDVLPIGTEIIQPGKLNNGHTDVIANLSEFEKTKLIISVKSKPENYIDAAIAKITDINIIRPQIAFMKNPSGVDSTIRINDFIKKSGATTGYTSGKVIDDSVSVEIFFGPYKTKSALYVDQFRGDINCDSGDSGSVVLNEYNNAVGMVMSVSKKGTVMNRMSNVLRIMNISLYTQA